MNNSLAACFVALSQIFAQCSAADAAAVMPVWQNDTAAHAISFQDTFGHQVQIGVYDPVAGTWTAQGVPGGFPSINVSGTATIGGTLGVTGQTTLGNLAVNGPLTGAGVSTYLSSPPPIGSTTPNTGGFTALSASGAVTGAGFNSLLAAPPVGIGSVTPNGAQFTTLSATGAVSGAGMDAYTAARLMAGLPGLFTTLSATSISNGASSISVSGTPFKSSVSPPGTMAPPAGPGIALLGGVPFYILGAPTSGVQDAATGTLYVAKDTNYAGSPVNGTPPAIYGFNNIHAGAQGPQAGILGVASNNNTVGSQPGGSAGAIGSYGTGNCIVTGCTATWGGVMAAYDTTSQVNPTHPLIGLEVDNYAHGTDASMNRVVLQLVANTPDHAGTLNTVGSGILFNGDGSASNGQYINLINGSTAKAVNGVVLAGMTLSGVAFNSPGFQVDSVGNIAAHQVGVVSSGAVFWGTDSGTSGGQIVIDHASTHMFLDDLEGGDLVYRTTGVLEAHRIKSNKTVQYQPLTVATLPTCNVGSEGSVAYVNDLNVAPVYDTAIGAGGGMFRVLAFCRNSTWTSH
jgi:hypothetical protein